MRKKMLLLVLAAMLTASACAAPKKEITVVIREPGSGTREAFDRTVSDGIHYLEEYGEDGKRIDRNSVYAIVQTKGGAMLSSVSADRNAIGYLSPSAVNEQVRILAINGCYPSEESVRNGSYPLSRPFIVFSNPLPQRSALCEDFWRYLKSDRMREHAEEASCVFLQNAQDRASPGSEPINVEQFTPLEHLPVGGKVIIRGSTSLEKLILSAAKGYAACYSVDPTDLFDLQLEGSSVGIRAVLEDRSGNVIGLSSASVPHPELERVTVARDALAVIVHPENPIQNLSLSQLYAIFSGEIKYFNRLEGVN